MSVGLATPVASLFGVGDRRKEQLDRLGLATVGDLLRFYPRRYHDLRNFKTVSRLEPGELASVKARVVAREERRLRGRVSFLKVAVSDDTGVLYLVFFNQAYLAETFTPDAEFFLNGRVEFYRGALQMTNPSWEDARRRHRDWLLPVYPLTRGLTQGVLRRLVRDALSSLADFPPELLPFERRRELGLPNARFALAEIHFPRSDKNLEKARDYLIFHEFLRLQLSLLARKARTQEAPGTAPIEVGPDVIDQFGRLMPFPLTKGQERAMREIVEDLRRGRLLQRLLQGEVGSGKTVVAVFLLWLVAKRGGQAVFLAPTEILAEQHFLNWQEFFLREGLPVALVIGQLPVADKEAIARRAASGELRVLIGTHALLSEKLVFADLRAVVVDEQHKFGVQQRELMRRKGEQAHYLIMSATPIPRSIALTFYGNLDFSLIGDLPKGERDVATYLVADDHRERVFTFIREQVGRGGQGFVVTPAIEGREDIRSAVREHEELRAAFPDIPIGLIHGKLPHEEKEAAMAAFRGRETLLLVATTVIESGIDVPEASFIIIEQAERFGLAQLHQLRGRVGRAGEPGCCLLVAHAAEGTALERLEQFLETERGLDIAEMDLRFRGPGDLLGTRQHGVLPFRIGNIVSDMRLLDAARAEAERVFRDDPGLERPGHEEMRRLILQETVHGT